MVSRRRTWQRWLPIMGLVLLLSSGCADNHENVTKYECFDAEAVVTPIYDYDFEYWNSCTYDLGLLRDPTMDTLIRFLRPTDEITRLEVFSTVFDPGDPICLAYTYWLGRADSGFASAHDIFTCQHYRFSFDFGVGTDGWWVRFPGASVRNLPVAYYAEFTRDGLPDTIGVISGDTLSLQRLKYRYPTSDDPLWDAEWKNVYNLWGKNLDYDQLEVIIYEGDREDQYLGTGRDNQNGIPYLQILGLDRADQSGTIGQPDGKIDNDPSILDLESGLLIFPDRRPFDTDVGYAVGAPEVVLHDRVPVIYDSDDYYAQRESSQYYIEVSHPVRPAYLALGHANLVGESEVVTLNGQTLTREEDYHIDYDRGEIYLLNDEATDPDAELTICYEYVP